MVTFEIGTIVIWNLYPDKTFEIIGDKENPYKGLGASPFNQPTFVSPGFDYLIRELDTNGVFKRFENVKHGDIKTKQ